MTTPASLESGEPMTYGYGLGVGDLEGEQRIAHGGGIPGYNTYLSYYPARHSRHSRWQSRYAEKVALSPPP